MPAIPVSASDAERQQTVIRLLEYAPVHRSDLVLDIGIGTGDIAHAIANRAGRVVGMGLAISSYGIDAERLGAAGIVAVEAIAERLPFAQGAFNVAIMSHVLEHTLNVGLALSEVWRILRTDGMLCILVPPHEFTICGGHVSTGWSIGQLMYVLALHGFDTRHGNYVRFGYNICAFVRKDARPLPALRYDYGDLKTLAADGRFPVPIETADKSVEAFFGDLLALNWPWPVIHSQTTLAIVARRLGKFLPGRLRLRLGRACRELGRVWMHQSIEAESLINPEALRL